MKTLLAILFLCASSFATVNDYYVNCGSGSDSNSGTFSSQWRTIAHALSAYSLGSTGSNIHVTGTCNENVSYSGNGTSSARLTLISDVPFAGKIVGQGTGGNVVHFGTGATNHGGNYLTIQGFEISGATLDQGIVLQGHDDWAIGNKVHDVQTNHGCPSGGGLGIGTQWNGVVDATSQISNIIAGNEVYRIGSQSSVCNFTHGIYVQTPKNWIWNNVIHEVSGYGIQTYHYVFSQVIANNTIFNINESCIFISADSAGVNDDHNAIINNIAFRCNRQNSSACIRATSGGSNSEGSANLIKNNMTVECNGGNYLVQNTTPTGTITSGTATTIFASYPGNVTLASGSPAIDAGTTTCASGGLSTCIPSTDFLGAARTKGLFPDLGAYEFGGTTATKPPPPTGLTAIVH